VYDYEISCLNQLAGTPCWRETAIIQAVAKRALRKAGRGVSVK
jgi:hypothetical protein